MSSLTFLNTSTSSEFSYDLYNHKTVGSIVDKILQYNMKSGKNKRQKFVIFRSFKKFSTKQFKIGKKYKNNIKRNSKEFNYFHIVI